MHEGKEEEEGENPAGYEINRAFDCPASWVEPLSLDRPRYLLRFPLLVSVWYSTTRLRPTFMLAELVASV